MDKQKNKPFSLHPINPQQEYNKENEDNVEVKSMNENVEKEDSIEEDKGKEVGNRYEEDNGDEEEGNGEEEGSGKEEEGSGKEEEGSGKEEEGSGKEEEGSGKEEEGSGKEEEGSGKEEECNEENDNVKEQQQSAAESCSEWENPDEDSPAWDSPEWSLEEEEGSPEKESSKRYEEMCATQMPGNSRCSIKLPIPKNNSCHTLGSPQKVGTPRVTVTDQSNSDRQVLPTMPLDPNIISENGQEGLIKDISSLPKRQLPVDTKTVKVNIPEKSSELKLNPEYEMPSLYELEMRCLKSLTKIQSIRNRDISCKSKTPTGNLTESSSKSNCPEIQETPTDEVYEGENIKKTNFGINQSIPEEKPIDSPTAPQTIDSTIVANGCDSNDIETVSSAGNGEARSSKVPQAAGHKNKCERLPIEKMKTWLRTRSLRSQARWKAFMKEKEKQSEQEREKKKKQMEQITQSLAAEFCQQVNSRLIKKYENLSTHKEGEDKLGTKHKPESTSQVKQKPESTSHTKEKPGSTSHTKEKPGSTSHTKEKHVSEGEKAIDELKINLFHIYSPESHDFDEFPVDSEESENENQNESENEESTSWNYMHLITGYSDIKHKTKAEMIQDIIAMNEQMIKASNSMCKKKTSAQTAKTQKEHSPVRYSERNVSEGKVPSFSGRSDESATALPLTKYNVPHSSDFKDKTKEEKIQDIIKKNNEMIQAMKSANVLKKQCSEDIEKELSFYRFQRGNEVSPQTAKAQNEHSPISYSEEIESKEKVSGISDRNVKYATALPILRLSRSSGEPHSSDSEHQTKEEKIQDNNEMIKAMKSANILKKQCSDDIEKELSFLSFQRGNETPSQLTEQRNESFLVRSSEDNKSEEKALDLSNKNEESSTAQPILKRTDSNSSEFKHKTKAEKIQDRLMKNVKEVKALKKIDLLKKPCSKDTGKELSSLHCQREKEKASQFPKDQNEPSLESCSAKNKSEEIAPDISCKKEKLATDLSYSRWYESDSSKTTENHQKASRADCISALLKLSASLSVEQSETSSGTCKLDDTSSEYDSAFPKEQQSESEANTTLLLKQEDELAAVSDESKNEEQDDQSSEAGDESYV